MFVVRRILEVAMSLAILGCGPQTHDPPEPQEWMIGAFSSLQEGSSEGQVSLQRVYLDPQGGFRQEVFSSCVTEASIVRELAWEIVDENTVRMPIPEEDQHSVRALLLQRLPECDSFLYIQEQVNGQQGSDPLYRGEICLTPLTCPEGGDCGCLRTYCDEAPAPLDCADD